jgi:hypothetical protein
MIFQTPTNYLLRYEGSERPGDLGDMPKGEEARNRDKTEQRREQREHKVIGQLRSQCLYIVAYRFNRRITAG